MMFLIYQLQGSIYIDNLDAIHCYINGLVMETIYQLVFNIESYRTELQYGDLDQNSPIEN